ncbi:MAG: SDR family NAD(P)-dependent oxidoreductase [Lachnospiraceae bacterium]|nr:SDR family NAD(P)-dependent oxidoreductase [Lachnospiraceae bacterium]
MNIIIITGASSGMGMEFALQLDNVFETSIDEIWLIARRKEQMLEVASSMEHTTRVLDMDVTGKDDMKRLKKLLAKEKPVIRMLVNCAGYGVMGEFSKLKMQEELGMIDVNCKALTQMTYLCIPFMRKNSRIIQLASSAAFMPQPGFAVYAATKAYVNSLSRALSEELRKKKIYVTSVCPGPVDTPFFNIAEKDGKILAIKKLTMVKAEQVVERAIKDSFHKKTVSVYSGYIKAFGILAKVFPHKLILTIMRFMK